MSIATDQPTALSPKPCELDPHSASFNPIDALLEDMALAHGTDAGEDVETASDMSSPEDNLDSDVEDMFHVQSASVEDLPKGYQQCFLFRWKRAVEVLCDHLRTTSCYPWILETRVRRRFTMKWTTVLRFLRGIVLSRDAQVDHASMKMPVSSIARTNITFGAISSLTIWRHYIKFATSSS